MNGVSKRLAQRLSRRELLALGGGALLSNLLGRGYSQAGEPLRIGVVVPIKTGLSPIQNAVYQIAGTVARQGAIMAEEEYGFNAELLGRSLNILVATAPNDEAAVRAAERLVSLEEVYGLIGGFGESQARVLSDVALERDRVFLNIGSSSDALRGRDCSDHTFHIDASAAMYLDALAGWFVRAGFRKWFFVYPDTDEGNARFERGKKSINNRHWGADKAGAFAVPEGYPDYNIVLREIEKSDADLVVMLFDAGEQLDFLAQYDGVGLEPPVTGFPDPVTQTRTFDIASRNAAPRSGVGHRVALWEATLDAYGARELNERYLGRWGHPMDGPAWAAYQAVKILFESAMFGGSTETADLIAHMRAPSTVFDVHKGIGVSFREWDNQLRQSMYLIKINSEFEKEWDAASLVGELPAIYKPGTDPIERLDQLGDLRRASRCRL